MLMRVWWWDNISCVVMKNAASLDLVADVKTNLMIWAIERTALLNQGKGSYSERMICDPAQL